MDIDPIRPSTLSELAAVEQDPCVSLLMPTHPTGADSRQDPIRLENLIDKAHADLKSRDMRRPDIEALLQPARDVIKQRSFWQHQGSGLAIYLADGTSRMLRLPEVVDESVTIGPHFNIKPLLGAVVSSEPFYVLALSEQRARLYQGARNDLVEIEDQGFPLAADEVVGVRDAEVQLQHDVGLPPRGGRGDRGHRGDMGQTGYHGHGEGETKLESDTLHFVKAVAERVASYLYGDEAPLVLAVDNQLFGLYRREHSRGRLVDSDHLGSPDALQPHEIRERAWKIASPLLQADRSAMLDRFGTAAAAGRSAQGFAEVAVAAREGKIDTLFFDPRSSQLGRLTDGGTSASLVDSGETEQQDFDVEDLVNLAIIDTLRASGQAIPLGPDPDRGPSPPKAILRY